LGRIDPCWDGGRERKEILLVNSMLLTGGEVEWWRKVRGEALVV